MLGGDLNKVCSHERRISWILHPRLVKSTVKCFTAAGVLQWLVSLVRHMVVGAAPSLNPNNIDDDLTVTDYRHLAIGLVAIFFSFHYVVIRHNIDRLCDYWRRGRNKRIEGIRLIIRRIEKNQSSRILARLSPRDHLRFHRSHDERSKRNIALMPRRPNETLSIICVILHRK